MTDNRIRLTSDRKALFLEALEKGASIAAAAAAAGIVEDTAPQPSARRPSVRARRRDRAAHREASQAPSAPATAPGLKKAQAARGDANPSCQGRARRTGGHWTTSRDAPGGL